MPRKIILARTDLNPFAAIGADFGLIVQDGDLIVPDANVRRVIMPDQDIDQQCDDLDAYFSSQGYPPITDADRQTLRDVRAAAEANPEMMARRDDWLVQQEQLGPDPAMVPAEPEPEPATT